MDTWVVSTIWILWKMLLWTLILKYLRPIFILLGVYLGVELLGLGYRIISLFNTLKNYESVFQSSWTILFSHQQCIRIPASPHPHQYVLSYILWGGIPLWFLIVVIDNIEQLFLCFLAVYVSPLEKCSFKCLPFFNWVVCSSLLSCKSILYILDTNPYQIHDLQIFFPFCGISLRSF